MSKIIKSTDGADGRISERERQQCTKINLNPVFTEEKPWKLIKVLKTTTKIVPWLIQINEEFIAVTQGPMWRRGDVVTFYRSTKKGTFDVMKDRIAEYNGYVDMETAVDLYYKENYTKTNTDDNEITQHITETI